MKKNRLIGAIKEFFDGVPLVFVILLIFVMAIPFYILYVGCDRTEKYKQEQQEPLKGYEVVVIDSCEYLIKVRTDDFGYSYGMMSHKGNCKFCEERNKNER